MKLKFLVFIMIFMGINVAPVFATGVYKVQGQEFFEALDDVPLMPGLYEMTDESVVFDKPGGRIIESVAAAEGLSAEEIRAFYNQVLPQMGWTRNGVNSFFRQGESLIMIIENRDDFNIVRFMVAPRQ